jgi:hypothetical protein
MINWFVNNVWNYWYPPIGTGGAAYWDQHPLLWQVPLVIVIIGALISSYLYVRDIECSGLPLGISAAIAVLSVVLFPIMLVAGVLAVAIAAYMFFLDELKYRLHKKEEQKKKLLEEINPADVELSQAEKELEEFVLQKN